MEPQFYEYQLENDGLLYNESEPIVEEEVVPFDPSKWDLFRQFSSMDCHPLASLEFDPYCNVLWSGSVAGRITSHLLPEVVEVFDRFEPFARYSSFQVCHDSPVLKLSPLKKHLLSLTRDKIAFHGKGGMFISRCPFPELIGEESSPSFTSGIELRPPLGREDPTHFFAGSSARTCFAFDIRALGVPVISFDVGVATSTCTTGERHILVGGEDGCVRLLDRSLRRGKVLQTLQGHSGPVSSIAAEPDGYTVVTCGVIARSNSNNSSDGRENVKFVPDPLIRVHDLRMNRVLPPLSMAMSTPSVLKFVASSTPLDNLSCSLLMVSSSGVLQKCPVSREHGSGFLRQDYSETQVFHCPMGHRQELLTAVACSTSGRAIAVASNAGMIACFGLGLPEVPVPSHGESLKPQSLEPSRPLMSLPVDSIVLGTSYVLRPNKSKKPLPSSFLTTPDLLTRKLELASARMLSAELQSKLVYQDFIGSAPSFPDAPRNSFIFGSGSTAVYVNADPRKQSTTKSGLAADVDGENNGSECFASSMPWQFQKVQSYRGKQRMLAFDYNSYNQTPFVGLENNCPNSFVNPILQLMHAVPEVREAALASQAIPSHHSKPTSLLCELGFLFHMITQVQSAERESVPYGRVVCALNFQRTFQQIPEAVALGLVDADSSSNSKIDPQQKLHTFSRFLLQQLKKECEENVRMNVHKLKSGKSDKTRSRDIVSEPSGGGDAEECVIDRVFGHSVVTTTTFLQSGSREMSPSHQVHLTDLVYPTVSAKTLGNSKAKKTSTSFAAIIWGSLRKEVNMRGWCPASETYEPFQQVRVVQSLPQLLCLSCGDTWKDAKDGTVSGVMGELSAQGSMHDKYWSRVQADGTSWLPVEMEVAVKVNEAGEYPALNVMESKNSGQGKSGGAHLLISTRSVSEGGEPKDWIIFNGSAEFSSPNPASMSPPSVGGIRDQSKPGEEWDVLRFKLFAVVSHVGSQNLSSGHHILHLQSFVHDDSSIDSSYSDEAGADCWRWFLFNDFLVKESNASEVTQFLEFRHPELVLFAQTGWMKASENSSRRLSVAETIRIPETVFHLPSLSSVSCIIPKIFPNEGEVVAFDGEFVSVEGEQAVINAEGSRVVQSEGRQVLARISLVYGGSMESHAMNEKQWTLLADDYIIPTETIVDYVTRFSGITAEDLLPATSKHALVDQRTAYLKLRYFADKQCIFVGHGLQKDFETANLFVPPSQVIDTVELWRLPNQRKISLRFLASYLLQADIQDEIHDSIVDAKTALRLFRLYQETAQKGPEYLMSKLAELYAYGSRTNWTIGLS